MKLILELKLRIENKIEFDMQSFASERLVDLTVGLPVSVRCTVIFARILLAMCPCSVCPLFFYISLSFLSFHISVMFFPNARCLSCC